MRGGYKAVRVALVVGFVWAAGGCWTLPGMGADVPGSNTVAALAGGAFLVLDQDHDGLSRFDMRGHKRILALGGTPGRLALRGHDAVVSLPYERQVVVVDVRAWRIRHRVEVGAGPVHVDFVSDTRAAVVLESDRALAIFDVQSGVVVGRHSLPLKWPSALAVAGGRALVADRTSGSLLRVDLDSGEAEVVEMRSGVSDRFLAQVASMTWAASQNSVLLAAPQLLSDANGAPAFVAASTTYYGPKEPSPLALTTVPEAGDPIAFQLEADIPVLRSASHRASDPVATALVQGDRGLAVLFRGSREVIIWSRSSAGFGRFQPCDAPSVRVDVGHGADGMAVTYDGTGLLVHNAADLTVTRIRMPLLGPGGRCPDGPAGAQTRTIAYGDMTLDPDVAEGRRLFYDGRSPELTSAGISCAFCHVDGMNDGLTWEAPNGPRNTPSLTGAAPGRTGIASTTLPLHWDGAFTTIADMGQTIANVMVGTGISDAQATSLAAFMDTLRTPDAPTPTAEEAQAMDRGRALFESPGVGCTSCHSGAHMTDNLNHPVMQNASMQTPVMHSLARTGPYMHDGSSETLEDVLEKYVQTDLMGHGSQLTKDQLVDLAAYLRSL